MKVQYKDVRGVHRLTSHVRKLGGCMATDSTVWAICNGPSALTVEHSTFDQVDHNRQRTHFKFVTRDGFHHDGLVVVAAIRWGMDDPRGERWILWVTNGSWKGIAEYSTSSRKGYLKEVSEFPNYAF